MQTAAESWECCVDSQRLICRKKKIGQIFKKKYNAQKSRPSTAREKTGDWRFFGMSWSASFPS
jgi:hypothetical protein